MFCVLAYSGIQHFNFSPQVGRDLMDYLALRGHRVYRDLLDLRDQVENVVELESGDHLEGQARLVHEVFLVLLDGMETLVVTELRENQAALEKLALSAQLDQGLVHFGACDL